MSRLLVTVKSCLRLNQELHLPVRQSQGRAEIKAGGIYVDDHDNGPADIHGPPSRPAQEVVLRADSFGLNVRP